METRGRVAVLGSGSMGATLAHVLASGDRSTIAWAPDPDACDRARAVSAQAWRPPGAAPEAEWTISLARAVEAASLVIVAVPSAEFRNTAEQIRSLVRPGAVLLSATKGLEIGSHRRMSEILGQLDAGPVGVIAGANMTTETRRGQLTPIIVAASEPDALELAVRVLSVAPFHVEPHLDVLSIEVAAALKNVVAVGLGIAAGLELGFNARSLLLTRGLSEIQSLGAALGADRAAFHGLAGLGDLFLTASSPDSLNRRAGIELGRGARLADIVGELPELPEGIQSVRACRELARAHALDLPFTEHIARIVDAEAPASSLLSCLERAAPGA